MGVEMFEYAYPCHLFGSSFSTPCALLFLIIFFFFFNDTATTEIYTLSYTLSLHDALPISSELQSHSEISYAVFCLKKKNKRDRKSTRLNSSHIQKTRMQSY